MAGGGGNPNPNPDEMHQHPIPGVPLPMASSPMGGGPMQAAFSGIGYFTAFHDPVMFTQQKTQRSRRKSATGLDAVKHRRTRSGCFMCRSRRVKVSQQPIAFGRTRPSNSRVVRRNKTYMRAYDVQDVLDIIDTTALTKWQVARRETENAYTPNFLHPKDLRRKRHPKTNNRRSRSSKRLAQAHPTTRKRKSQSQSQSGTSSWNQFPTRMRRTKKPGTWPSRTRDNPACRSIRA